MSEVCVCVYVSESTKNIYLFEPSKPKLFSVDSSEEGRFHNPQRWRNKVWKHLKLSSTWVFTFCLCLCIAVPPFPPPFKPHLCLALPRTSLFGGSLYSLSLACVFSISLCSLSSLSLPLPGHIYVYICSIT